MFSYPVTFQAYFWPSPHSAPLLILSWIRRNKSDNYEGHATLGKLHVPQFRRTWIAAQIVHHFHGKSLRVSWINKNKNAKSDYFLRFDCVKSNNDNPRFHLTTIETFYFCRGRRQWASLQCFRLKSAENEDEPLQSNSLKKPRFLWCSWMAGI